jgi:hypothetical protein
MIYKIFNLILALITLAFLSCRKKYPENILKGIKPYKLELMRGFITKYEVNGIDSLDLLNNYLKQAPSIQNKIQNCDIQLDDQRERNRVVMPSHYLRFQYGWNSDYDKIYIFHKNDTSTIRKNIFLINVNNWDILRLVRSTKTVKHQLKIKSTIGANTYIIQFN